MPTRALFALCKMFDLPHLGVKTPENADYVLEVQTWQRSLYNVPTPKFHNPIFHHSEIIVSANIQTSRPRNKQRDSVENIHLTLYATLVESN